MPRIRKLDNATISQIAAGEVVVQPCSVLKELVENSLDAGATRVEAELMGGGAELILVADDGCGMDREDLLLSIEPHATSKIQGAADIHTVLSCGFRGEALASIAAVGELEITSAPKGGEAHRLFGGPSGFALERASRSEGSTVSVRNLFHNVPVRRRFLKSARAEGMACAEVLRRLALARPWVGFRLRSEGRTSFSLGEDEDLAARVRSLGLFERETVLLPVRREEGDVKVTGLVAAPPCHHSNSQRIYFFVNRRPFFDRPLVQALVQAFASLIPERRYPGAVVAIELPPEEVDVNIHPTKSEVRFRDPGRIFRAVQGAAREVLADKSFARDGEETRPLVYSMGGSTRVMPMNRGYGGIFKGGEPPRPFAAPKPTAPGVVSLPLEAGALEPRATYPKAQTGPEAPSPALFPALPGRQLRAFQILQRYIILEREDCIEILDQHAIHERVLFNQLAHEEAGGKTLAQMLLAPELLKLPPGLGEIPETVAGELRRAGYDFEVRGDVLALAAIPACLTPSVAAAALDGHLAELAEGTLPDADLLRRHLLHTAACKAAVKAGEILSEDRLRTLAAAAATLDSTQGCCPHGRNAVWRITRAEADARFDR